MFTPGRTPGQMDRRALGQRLLSQLVPQLQSFRFQGGKPGMPAPAMPAGLTPSTPTAPMGGAARMGAAPARPMPGLSNGLAAPPNPAMDYINNGANYDGSGQLRPQGPAPSAAPSARPSAPRPAPRPAAPALGRPAPAQQVQQSPIPGLSMPAFLKYLASLQGDGGSGGTGGGMGGAEAAAGNAGGGGGMGSFA